MKKFLPLIIMLAILSGAGCKLLLAQQYRLLCLSKAIAALALAPNYLPDSFASALPFLFK